MRCAKQSPKKDKKHRDVYVYICIYVYYMYIYIIYSLSCFGVLLFLMLSFGRCSSFLHGIFTNSKSFCWG